MKRLLIVALLSIGQLVFSQAKGTVSGKLTDKDMNGEALPFANVFVKGTSIGSTTDMDGNYTISVPVGNQTIVFSFVGYKTIEKQVTVVAGKTVVINQEMGSSEGVALEEVKITGTVSKEKESALLLEQKKATVIKESIGAAELSKKGVSNAAAATTKISGVTKSEGSGDIYIRGLGDRYLSTTMNGLPIPSDDVSNKNINLNLFSTSIIENVGISKTYSTSGYADQGSGNVDIVSKNYSKNGLKVGISGGVNTTVLGQDNFKQTIITDDVSFGFHEKKYSITDAITKQGWTPKETGMPFNYGLSLGGGVKFKLFGATWKYVGSGSFSSSSEYRHGLFKSFRANYPNNLFSYVSEDSNKPNNRTKDVFDTERFITTQNATAYSKLAVKLNKDHNISYNILFVNKGKDVLYEQGRKGLGYVLDHIPAKDTGAFRRDQNFKQTTVIVNQFVGKHQFSDNYNLKWAGGYNYVLAEEPNRIRNDVNILDINKSPKITYAFTSDFQQRKSSQKIKDKEINGLIENRLRLGTAPDEYEKKPHSLNFGVNLRRKERNFNNTFIGVKAKGFNAPSVDELNPTFVSSNFESDANPNGLILRKQPQDTYTGELLIYAGFVNFDFKFDKFSGNVGVRYERDDISVNWDVTNFQNRKGSLTREYQGFYPSVNLKYELTEKQFLRFASSLTQTLPEFKELAPFEYVSPTGRVIKGEPTLEKSDILNLDLKWELFPSREELVSATVFYKQIKNPINKALSSGSSGNFKFFNTGDKADILGLELEGKVNVLKNEDDKSLLSATGNITLMYLNQDIYRQFQYKNVTETKLQGASDFIFNGSLSYNSRTENPFITTLTANYSSDKIYALGGNEDLKNSDTLYNDEIIENGFITLDAVVSKKINKYLTAKLVGKNLLNPEIKQTQLINRPDTGEKNEVVQLYTKGTQVSLGLSLSF